MFRKIIWGLLTSAFLLFLYQATLCAFATTEYYQIEMEKANGSQGYYRTVPNISLRNKKTDVVVRYHLQRPDARKTVGKVSEGRSANVLNGVGADGQYVLDLWAESPEGDIVSGSETSKCFFVDSKMDRDALVMRWDAANRGIYFDAKDSDSGVAKIVYQIGDNRERVIKGCRGFVTISEHFEGTVKAYVVDVAGNRSAPVMKRCKSVKKVESVAQPLQEERVEVKQKKPSIRVTGCPDYEITSQNMNVGITIKNATDVKKIRSEIMWEKPDGTVVVWKDNASRWNRRLTEDGIYKIKIWVSDKKGKVYETKRQCVIDKTKPRITHLNQAKKGTTVTIEELVEEFTSYTYEIIDGEVLVVRDAAGNESTENLTKILGRYCIVTP